MDIEENKEQKFADLCAKLFGGIFIPFANEYKGVSMPHPNFTIALEIARTLINNKFDVTLDLTDVQRDAMHWSGSGPLVAIAKHYNTEDKKSIIEILAAGGYFECCAFANKTLPSVETILAPLPVNDCDSEDNRIKLAELIGVKKEKDVYYFRSDFDTSVKHIATFINRKEFKMAVFLFKSNDECYFARLAELYDGTDYRMEGDNFDNFIRYLHKRPPKYDIMELCNKWINFREGGYGDMSGYYDIEIRLKRLLVELYGRERIVEELKVSKYPKVRIHIESVPVYSTKSSKLEENTKYIAKLEEILGIDLTPFLEKMEGYI